MLWFSSCWSGVELRVVSGLQDADHNQELKSIIQSLLPVACMVWVTEGQLKKRVRVI